MDAEHFKKSIAAAEEALGRIVMRWAEIEFQINGTARKFALDTPDLEHAPSYEFNSRLTDWKKIHLHVLRADPGHCKKVSELCGALQKARVRRHCLIHGHSFPHIDGESGNVDGLAVSVSTDDQQLLHKWFARIKPELIKLGIKAKPPSTSQRRAVLLHFGQAELLEMCQVILPGLCERARELDRTLRKKILPRLSDVKKR
jgi:hypothetical protein